MNLLMAPAHRRGTIKIIVTALAMAVGARVSSAEQETFQPSHVAKIRTVTSAKISPDGRYVAYTLSVPRTPHEDDNGPAWRELHVVDTAETSRPFITGEVNVGDVDWTPDGKGISFLAKRGDDKHKCLYVIPIGGGEARRVLSHETSINSYSWSPDGKRVAFLAKKKKAKDKKDLADKGFNQEIYEEDWRAVRAWIATPDDEDIEPRDLELTGSASTVRWSPAGGQLALALAPTPLVDHSLMSRKVVIVDVDSGDIVGRLNNPGKLGDVVWSPDGTQLAIISGEDMNDPSAGRLMVGAAKGGPLRDIIPGYEGHVRATAWYNDERLAFVGHEGVRSLFGQAMADGSRHRASVAEGNAILRSMSLARETRAAAFVADSPTHPAEVYYQGQGDTEPHRLTQSNPWMSEVRLAKQEAITFNARDGLKLEGILVRPLDEEPGKRYPLILSVHGGPESHISNGWVTSYSRPGQTGAARGFAVFYPNYRGSTGRGVAFSKLGQADYAGKEFDDLVDAVDHLVSIGLVDKNKAGVTGGSYGGFASAWCATKLTEHFAASVMFVGISDLVSKFGTTDIPQEMFLVHARRWPWDHWKWFVEQSPITYAKDARTPILIAHGKNDTRVHPSQSLELYRYLKTSGKTPVRLVWYPGEGHGNRKAAARLDYSMRQLRWMEHYLIGPGGDPPPYELNYGFDKPDEDETSDD